MITVCDEEIIKSMREENGWWSKKVASGMKYSQMQSRGFLNGLKTLVLRESPNRTVILLGPRRVGKTVMLHHIIRDLMVEKGVEPETILYLQIDNPLFVGRSLRELLDLHKKATGRDWKREKCYLFFDEIQYLPSWEVELKSLHDMQTGSQFTVSSSAQVALSKSSKESGAGRFTDYLLPPLLFSEYIAFKNETSLVYEDENGYFSSDIDRLNELLLEYVNFGGYPEIALNQSAQIEALRYMRSDILDKVLLRDLPSLFGIYDVREVYRLFTMLVYNSGHELSIDNLSQSCAVSKNTLRKYLEYLEAAFLLKTIYRVDRLGKRFQRDRTFKVYLTNTSVRSGLFTPLTMDSEHLGHAMETALISQNFHHTHEFIHCARWKSGRVYYEVDMVRVNMAMQIKEVVEVKFTDRVSKQRKTWKPWLELCRKNNINELTITTKTTEDVVQVDGITVKLVPTAIYIYQQGEEELKKLRDLSPSL